MNKHEKLMARALLLADKGSNVFPNPKVGAIIAKKGRIVGEGYHREFGGPHAEIFALEAANEQARGADLYITLEPCDHFGKTPPCTEKIITSGVGAVYVAMKDPNPLVYGKGIAKLKRNGVKVVTGILKDEAELLNAHYLHYVKYKRPFVIAKWAMSLDGKIATKTGDSKWISNTFARQAVHSIRSSVGAIIVGAHTVLCDDPFLTVRDVKKSSHNPWRVILDRHLKAPLTAHVFNKDGKTIVVTDSVRITMKEKQLMKMGVAVWHVQSNKELLHKLAHNGISRVLVEGGGKTHASFLHDGLVDKIIAFIGAKVIGGADAPTPVEGAGIPWMKDALALKNVSWSSYGDTLVCEGDIIGKK